MPINSDTPNSEIKSDKEEGFKQEGHGIFVNGFEPMQIEQHSDGRRILTTARGDLFCKCNGLMDDVRSCLLKTVAVLNVVGETSNRRLASEVCRKCAEMRERALCELAMDDDD